MSTLKTAASANQKAFSQLRLVWLTTAAILAVMLLLGFQSSAHAQNEPAPLQSHRFLVQLKSAAVLPEALPLLTNMDGIVRETIYVGNEIVELWKVPDDRNLQRLSLELLNSELVLLVEDDIFRRPHAEPNDAEFTQQWYARNDGRAYNGAVGVAGADAQLASAWNITTGSADVVVAVIDNGVDTSHPDLAANLWQNPGEIAGNGIDDDGNGFIDDVVGWDFASKDANPQPDSAGRNHGTAVAGVLGARGNNAQGIAGASWNVSIMVLKTDFSISNTIRALEYARNNGAHIANVSFGGSQFSAIEYQAMERLRDSNVLLVASAGNEHWNNDFGSNYPSSYNLPNILAVAATDSSDQLTRWSQFGQISVDIGAPGNDLITTEANGNNADSHYGLRSGTSFSSPLTAGVAALVKSQYPQADYSELKGRILASADLLTDASCTTATGGRVNASAALAVAEQPVPTISHVSWMDNNNRHIDSNESATLRLEFETYWQAGDETSVVLSTNSDQLQIIRPTQLLASLPKDQTISVDFPVRSAQLTGQHTIPLTVQFESAAYTGTRQTCLLAAPLSIGSRVDETIQQNRQDDSHRFIVEVAENTDSLTLALTADNNLDLYLRRGGWPGRDEVLRTSTSYRSGAETIIAAGTTGSEQITINAPDSGTWYAVVVNASQLANSRYQLAASSDTTQQPTQPAPTDNPPPANNDKPAPESASGDGGGGGGGGAMLLLALLAGITSAVRFAAGQLSAIIEPGDS